MLQGSQFQNIAFNIESFQKDGAYGFGLGVLMDMYHFTAALKLKIMEYHSTNPGEQIREQYQCIADEIMKKY